MTPELKPKVIAKKITKYAAAPAILGLTALSSGCGAVIESTHFPPCSVDPETKVQNLTLQNSGFWNDSARDHFANIDGVQLRIVAANPRRVDVMKSEENRVQYVDATHLDFEGNSDGRAYEITLPPFKDNNSNNLNITVTGTCKTPNSQK